MSWQDYVDNQLLASRCISKAAIAGHDGGVWAKSEGFEVNKFNNNNFVLKNLIIFFSVYFEKINFVSCIFHNH